ncbi:MAG TPA: hypothetical protein VGC80_04225 [Acetobacteraceae bacterium]
MENVSDSTPDRCLLNHPIFTSLGSVIFRRAETDSTPVMVIQLGDRQAAVPLRALQREFSIDDECPDGRMLGLIAESLDFVNGLHIGDVLPSEVLTGRASWEPGRRHRERVAARLKWQLLVWLNPDMSEGGEGAASRALQLDTDPALRQQVHQAFVEAARVLQLRDTEAVLTLLENLTDELSYIEALRDQLLLRVQKLAVRLERMGPGYRSGGQRLETMTQVQRLVGLALKQILGRFEEVDAQTGEVMAALRNIDSQQAFIRSNRDMLYRSLRAWEPILREWDGIDGAPREVVWSLIGRSYHFLAPRYMPVQEWQSISARWRARSKNKLVNAMCW